MEMKKAYLDCFSGISGDMFLGALVDSGVSLTELRRYLSGIPLKGYRITSRKVLRGGISSTKVDVIVKPTPGRGGQGGTTWNDIKKLVDASALPAHIRQKGLKVFQTLFDAEAEVHGAPFDEVHLHELGGVDCVIDIFGAILGLDMLGVSHIMTSAVNLGSGTVSTAHGMLPVPAPATIALLRNYPVYSSGTHCELTTPTGAALIKGLGATAVHHPPMRIEKIGYGAGGKEIRGAPNVLRVTIGKSSTPTGAEDAPDDSVVVIEANIDDMNPQLYETVMGRLFSAGALDVFLEQIIMKKSRPGIKLTVIGEPDRLQTLADTIFKETTTIGLRFRADRRKVLTREIRKIRTKFGDLRIKVSRLGADTVTVSPEYEDVKALAERYGIPIKKILAELPRYYPKR